MTYGTAIALAIGGYIVGFLAARVDIAFSALGGIGLVVVVAACLSEDI